MWGGCKNFIYSSNMFCIIYALSKLQEKLNSLTTRRIHNNIHFFFSYILLGRQLGFFRLNVSAFNEILKIHSKTFVLDLNSMVTKFQLSTIFSSWVNFFLNVIFPLSKLPRICGQVAYLELNRYTILTTDGGIFINILKHWAYFWNFYYLAEYWAAETKLPT